mgnify:CR=1 FL=1
MFHVDRAALLYIANKSTLTRTLARWALLLQEFTFEVDRPGSQHALADYLSRLEVDHTAAIPDNLPDATILTITPITTGEDPNSWLQEIEHYLLTGMVLPNIEGEARKKLALRSRQFSLVDGLVYYTSAYGVLRRVARHHEIPAILTSFHAGIAGGHYSGDVTAGKIW